MVTCRWKDVVVGSCCCCCCCCCCFRLGFSARAVSFSSFGESCFWALAWRLGNETQSLRRRRHRRHHCGGPPRRLVFVRAVQIVADQSVPTNNIFPTSLHRNRPCPLGRCVPQTENRHRRCRCLYSCPLSSSLSRKLLVGIPPVRTALQCCFRVVHDNDGPVPDEGFSATERDLVSVSSSLLLLLVAHLFSLRLSPKVP